jgi:hypothetical protein
MVIGLYLRPIEPESGAALSLSGADEHVAAAAWSIGKTRCSRGRGGPRLRAETSMRSGTLIRFDIGSHPWQASALRAAPSRPRALNHGQLIRSIVLVGASIAIVAAIALEPVHQAADDGSAGDRTAWDRPHVGASVIFSDQRMALDQLGTGPSADSAQHAY